MSMHMAYPEWCGNVQGAEKLNEYMVRASDLVINVVISFFSFDYIIHHFCKSLLHSSF